AGVKLTSTGEIRLDGNPADTTVDAAGAPKPDGVPDSLRGSLATSSNLELTASQVYPTTLTEFTLEVPRQGGLLRISPNGAPASAAYSVLGAVNLYADQVEQAGVLKAPLGRLTLGRDPAGPNPSASVALLPGSLTSVSANGLMVPFGQTVGGQTWEYLTPSSGAIPVSTLRGKQVSLRAANVVAGDGAAVDGSGGGDFYGLEFLSGSGGTTDFLAQSGVFAVLPASALQFAPSDLHLAAKQKLGFDADTNIYDSVYLSGAKGLPEGRYVLLPAYY